MFYGLKFFLRWKFRPFFAQGGARMQDNAIVPFVSSRTAVISCDVHRDEVFWISNVPGWEEICRWENRTAALSAGLERVREAGRAAGFGRLVVVAEPTGVYHRLLFRVARRRGLETALVNTEAVAKMRQIEFNDSGKTDRRDPRVIGRVWAIRAIRDRALPGPFAPLRSWGKVYAEGEKLRAQAKAAIQTHLRGLFPDFPMKKDFLFGPSGRALEKLYGLNPWRIRAVGVNRFAGRLKAALPRLRRHSLERLWEAAGDSLQAEPRSEAAVADKQLRQLWRDLQWAERRCTEVGAELQRLYDQARELDPRLPEAWPGVVSPLALARLIGELGPLSDFRGWRELLRYVGLNLRERQSGQFVGQVRITRKGRPLARRILNQMALPLVKRNRLFGPYYHAKKRTMAGDQAMTAVTRKLLKMLWGWYQAGRSFDLARVFACESQAPRVNRRQPRPSRGCPAVPR
jgi:transposase